MEWRTDVIAEALCLLPFLTRETLCCLSVCTSVCHKSVFCQNCWTDRTHFWHTGFVWVIVEWCVMRKIRVPPKMRVLPSGAFSETLDLRKISPRSPQVSMTNNRHLLITLSVRLSQQRDGLLGVTHLVARIRFLASAVLDEKKMRALYISFAGIILPVLLTPTDRATLSVIDRQRSSVDCWQHLVSSFTFLILYEKAEIFWIFTVCMLQAWFMW